jgi:inhibitor of KinA sporulation pathway (predicted exonuclease)
MKNKKIIVVDLEATCWKDNKTFQREHSEIIEIGICLIDIATGDITQNKGILVKPDHSRVSEFCEELTTISQSMIDTEGVGLKTAVELLLTEYNTQDYIWSSYGGYDKSMFIRQCKAKNIKYPFGADHINVKELFKEKSKMNKSVGMKKALNILKIQQKGTHHRGVDDAYNIAKILHWCLNQ